jgi:hypothetical protein
MRPGDVLFIVYLIGCGLINNHDDDGPLYSFKSSDLN